MQAVGGNIMTASPISDLNPLFMAAGVTVEVASQGEGFVVVLTSHILQPVQLNYCFCVIMSVLSGYGVNLHITAPHM